MHMDDAENIGAGTVRIWFWTSLILDEKKNKMNPKFNQVTADFTYENDFSWIAGAGHGYAGFYLSYWQQSCGSRNFLLTSGSD